ncbi:helix-turn-helix transcriptional regulator [Streptomyces sp. RerS4]|uniref:helix-turn-helix domain-containing protein n=1 Tax=Streptomyces sp. RerS4 TaxID=2942449 RepID=UPI00201C1AB4|nr:helix-turn-helix transcriptional regulator [Streptomyces sp. RerS4]UQX01769.1 helix-turn-helix transcriptional regulator [Streptomyces sp. RerS4]
MHTKATRQASIAIRVPDQRAEPADMDAHIAGTCDCAPLRGAVNDPRGIGTLTGRERQVLTLLGHGMSNRLIARRLGIVERTAKAHVASIVEKLGVSSRLEAALMAHLHHTLICAETIVPRNTTPRANVRTPAHGC